jgi:GNAT superfamily N-acetyltransferase
MIRQFQPEDAPACSAIIHACVKAESSYPAQLCCKILAGETPLQMQGRAALFYVAVYEEEHRVLGFVGLDMNEIRLLYVDPESQRRGIGRSLLDHIRTLVPAPVFAEIFVYSTPGAAGFYRACGFKNRGPFVFDQAGITLKTVFMILPVAAVDD